MNEKIKLEKEFEYYIKHQNELVEKYNDKYIVIKDQEVIGAYDSPSEAYNETKKVHEVGTFLIQHCSSGKASYTQTYHTHRVSFS